jgi:hypothetical protein
MLNQLHNNICEQIKGKIPEIQTCSNYPRMRNELVAPACFVEISSFEIGTDPGTEELALVANFEARIVIDSTIPNAEFAIRELALQLANLINHNTWSSRITPAKIKDIGPDAFKPELDAYIVWNINWAHTFHIGENVWESTGILPHTIFVNGEANDL